VRKYAALKALVIAGGGITVVPNRACELCEGNIFSGECYGGVSNFSGLHELTLFGFGTFAEKSDCPPCMRVKTFPRKE